MKHNFYYNYNDNKDIDLARHVINNDLTLESYMQDPALIGLVPVPYSQKYHIGFAKVDWST